MKPKVLVIEDNENNIYLITFLLEQNGVEVMQAMDGPAGIEMAGQGKPDLILLDIQLPGMDGYQVAKKLRANTELAEVSIVAVTSYAMSGDREKCIQAGCTDYIEKPINPKTFMSQIEKYLPKEDREAMGGK